MFLAASAGHFRKSANCGLKILVYGFTNRFLTANICGFAVKKLKSTANPQINNITEIVSAISKKIHFYIQCIDRFGWMQARRHGKGGAIRGRAPQMTTWAPANENCPPPKRGLCHKEITNFGATGMQIEALDYQISADRPRIRKQELFFRNFCGITSDFIKLRVYFRTKTSSFLFFWSIFKLKVRNVEIFELKTFFFSFSS